MCEFLKVPTSVYAGCFYRALPSYGVIVSTKHPIKLYHRYENDNVNPFISRAAKKTNSGITMIPNNKNYTIWGDCAGNIFKTGEFFWQKSFDN